MEESYGTRTGVGTDGGAEIVNQDILYPDTLFNLCLYILSIFKSITVTNVYPFVFDAVIIAF